MRCSVERTHELRARRFSCVECPPFRNGVRLENCCTVVDRPFQYNQLPIPMRCLGFVFAFLLFVAPPSPAQPEPCTVGFDYEVSTEETNPGKTFELFGNWGPEQLDRAPDLASGGAMGGGYGRLEVLEWTADRIRVRVGQHVFPGGYNLSVFCGPQLRGISPFKSITVRQPNPSFDYTLSASSVRLGENLELSGEWGLRFDRKPILLYSNRRERMELEVVSWTDDLVTVHLPVLVDGKVFGYSETELFIESEKPYLMVGYKKLELLAPSENVLYRARVEAGIIAPWYFWFRESRRNQAIFIGVPFLIGSLAFGIRAMVAASSDFALAGLFLTLWIWPYTFGRELLSELGMLWIIEFIVIHASAFMAAMSMIKMSPPKRAGVFLGLARDVLAARFLLDAHCDQVRPALREQCQGACSPGGIGARGGWHGHLRLHHFCGCTFTAAAFWLVDGRQRGLDLRRFTPSDLVHGDGLFSAPRLLRDRRGEDSPEHAQAIAKD